MARRALVAVVDDDQTLADLIVDVLDVGGFDAFVISDPETAVARVISVCPVVVLLDIQLKHSQLDWQIIEQLGADPRSSSIPVVVCTANVGFLAEHADELAARGVPCLPKPFEIDDLIAIIANAAGRFSGGRDDMRPSSATM